MRGATVAEPAQQPFLEVDEALAPVSRDEPLRPPNGTRVCNSH